MSFPIQSFANIAKATPDQLRNLPGFGQVKVKNLVNALDKPLRSISTRLPERSQGFPLDVGLGGPGIEPGPADSGRRESSPEWDIELDLNDDGSSSTSI